MSAVKDANFIAIQGWMRTKLNLKGNELLIYALIYGFSQDGNSKFTGTRRYIAEWCGCSMRTVDNTLGSLVAKKLIVKHEEYVNGVRTCEYAAISPETASRQNDTQSPANTTTERDAATPASAAAQSPAQAPWASAPNATPEQSQTPIAEPEPKPQPKKTRKAKSFDDIIDAYTSDPTTKDLLGAWLQNRKAKRAAMTDRAIQGNIAKLDNCAQASHMSVNDYLTEVICRGWSSFFPIDNYKRTGYQQQSQQPSWTPTEEERRQQEEADEYFLNNCVF